MLYKEKRLADHTFGTLGTTGTRLQCNGATSRTVQNTPPGL